MTAIKILQKEIKNGTAIMVESPANRLYLTGFSSSDGYIIITNDRAVFFADSRYFEKAQQSVKQCEVRLLSRFGNDVSGFLKENKINTVYAETGYQSVRMMQRYKEMLECELSYDSCFDEMITQMRSCKSNQELNKIRKAQRLTDDTFSYIISKIKAGVTEREIALDMEFYIRRAGSEGVSFDFIVVSGKNSSLPHGVPTDKKIQNGDFITMDFGAVCDGYRSDMTRTVAVGAVSDEQIRVYNTVLEAQKKSIAAVRAGAVCKDIDRIARDFIDKAGYEGCFGHGLGHSVGIDIHENPSFSPRCETVLKPGNVMTVEPGIYLSGRFGVRIEDMVFVTENGFENITNSEKELIVL